MLSVPTIVRTDSCLLASSDPKMSTARERQRAELAKLKLMPGPPQERVNEIIKYMQLRTDAWRLVGKAVQTNNAALMAAAKRKQDEAMALGKTFGTTAERFEHR